MTSLKHTWLHWSLLICLLLMNGMMAAPSVTHAEHHAAHTGGTHGGGLCAWMCAAGQGTGVSLLAPYSTFHSVSILDLPSFDGQDAEFSSRIYLRGPPSHSL